MVCQVEFLRSRSNSPPMGLGCIRGPRDHSVLSSLSKRARQPDDTKGVALDHQRTENLRHRLRRSGPGSRKGWSPCNYVSARLHERSCFFAQLSANCFSSCSCLCLLDRIFKHQLSDLMFDGDIFRPNRCVRIGRSDGRVLYAWHVPANCDRCTPALAGCQFSRRNKCQVSKKAGACSGLLYSQ